MLLGVSGCQYVPERSEDSPFYPPPAGSRLVLHEDLKISAHKGGVFIQGGEIQSSYWAIQQYYPYCEFEVRKVKAEPQTVHADTFVITKTVQEADNPAAGLPGTHPMFASAHGMVAMVDNGIGPEGYSTVMYLESPRQPNVLRITCSHWQDPPLAEHLTIAEIRGALGEIFELQLAE